MPASKVYPIGDFTNLRITMLSGIEKKLQAGEDVIGWLAYDNGPETFLECWDCCDPLIVHLEAVKDGRVFFHVAGSEVLRSVPTSWIKGVACGELLEGAVGYACITPPWVTEYDSRTI